MGNDKHNLTKRKLKIAGFCVLGVSVVLSLIGLIDLFTAISSDRGMPKLFWMLFIGFPLIAVGVNLLMFGYKREISKYVKDESIPVINEAGKEIQPAVSSIAQAVKEGLSDSDTIVCPSCGAGNPTANKYCKDCGKPLVKICPECKTAQSADSVFCGNCGAKLQ